MSIAITEALIQSGESDIDTIMSSIRDEFIKGSHSPENNRAPGNACLAGVSRLESGIDWRKSGVKDSKGCGSAMRVASIGYLYQDDPEKLKEVAIASGICTHRHITAKAVSVGAAYLVKLALDQEPPEDFIPKLLVFTKGLSKEFDNAIKKVSECLEWENEEKALTYLGGGWIGEEAVALALYCFLRNQDDYPATVIRAANKDVDSDSIACITGSISGAYLCIDHIPSTWCERIEKSEYLKDMSDRLADKKSSMI
jgi:ADP-ribosylglycohydrolase